MRGRDAAVSSNYFDSIGLFLPLHCEVDVGQFVEGLHPPPGATARGRGLAPPTRSLIFLFFSLR